MASFADNPELLVGFNPYIQQLPVEEMVAVGMEKQRRYDEGVQKIQSSKDRIAGLDIIRDVDKKYPITLDPALRLLFTRLHPFAFRPGWLRRIANTALVGTIHPEERHPVSRVLMRLYAPVARWALTWKWTVIGGACVLVLVTIAAYQRLGSEAMPPLDEGALFYMPSTMPGISIGEAQKLLQVTDRIIKQFPEVDRVLGKAGRADSATDPVPLSMLETVILLKPKSEWRTVDTWYSGWAPEWAKSVLRRVSPDHISTEELVGRLNTALQIPDITGSSGSPKAAAAAPLPG